MRKYTLLILILMVSSVHGQRIGPPSKTELDQITQRGRNLAEYDTAAWYRGDAVMAMNPAEGSVVRYIAKKNGESWTVAFGRLNEARDKFLITYEAIQGTTKKEFSAKKFAAPKEDVGFFLFAARALDISLADFQGAARPYNVAVLPANAKQLYVYVMPAQTKQGSYPLGSDARYLVSEDGSKIIEKRQLHVSIIEFSPEESQKVEMGYHTAILDDSPEDTDVFHVLARKPSVPEWIATKLYVFRIEPDGAINYVMTREAFTKIKPRP
jgi:hypothetical protein